MQFIIFTRNINNILSSRFLDAAAVAVYRSPRSCVCFFLLMCFVDISDDSTSDEDIFFGNKFHLFMLN
ncbi:Cardiolipin synthase (CMP-forming) / mitochondrial hydrolase fusion protein [Trichinella spiralis]|uniref:Cardiolipin synthase (CMP-forming) / mitochondrial hydrolase fusion protein n=1 Tax=Trichinella spiralis TaxID=6334 RepID=A0ABR3L184_TRISP